MVTVDLVLSPRITASLHYSFIALQLHCTAASLHCSFIALQLHCIAAGRHSVCVIADGKVIKVERLTESQFRAQAVRLYKKNYSFVIANGNVVRFKAVLLASHR